MLAAGDKEEMMSWLNEIKGCMEEDQGATRSVLGGGSTTEVGDCWGRVGWSKGRLGVGVGVGGKVGDG